MSLGAGWKQRCQDHMIYRGSRAEHKAKPQHCVTFFFPPSPHTKQMHMPRSCCNTQMLNSVSILCTCHFLICECKLGGARITRYEPRQIWIRSKEQGDAADIRPAPHFLRLGSSHCAPARHRGMPRTPNYTQLKLVLWQGTRIRMQTDATSADR